MIIKRLSPKELSPDAEVKYMLTADIAEMAAMVDMHVERLRALLSFNTGNRTTYYGNARPTSYFMDQAEREGGRKLSLSQIDVRMQDGFTLDASASFLIAPLYVTRPLFVGDLEAATDVRYELVPHVNLTALTMGNQVFYQHPGMPQPFRNFARDENNAEGFEVDFSLMGFDLMLLPNQQSQDKLKAVIHQGLESMNRVMTEIHENHNVTYDYGFGVELKYIYTSDMKGDLRIDHIIRYKGRDLYRKEYGILQDPFEMLGDAIGRRDKTDESNFEAYEIMRVIHIAPGYEGIGYRRS